MNMNVIGMQSDTAIGLALSLYDDKDTPKEKLKLLLNNRPIAPLPSDDEDSKFKSGKTVDINASELLGLGLISAYHDWTGEQAGNTYQVITGLEDAVKPYTENYLSDGALWHDQAEKKMVYQQVMAQGFYPAVKITTAMIADQIKKKADRRGDYPENCGLIVNIYGTEGEVNINELATIAKSNIDKFQSSFIVWYKLPELTHGRVIYLDVPNALSLNMALKRHSRDEKWRFNDMRKI